MSMQLEAEAVKQINVLPQESTANPSFHPSTPLKRYPGRLMRTIPIHNWILSKAIPEHLQAQSSKTQERGHKVQSSAYCVGHDTHEKPGMVSGST
jgi:hypothetical protein